MVQQKFASILRPEILRMTRTRTKTNKHEHLGRDMVSRSLGQQTCPCDTQDIAVRAWSGSSGSGFRLWQSLIFFSLLFGFPCFSAFRGIPCRFECFSLLFQGFEGFGRDGKSLHFWWFSLPLPKKARKRRSGVPGFLCVSAQFRG